MGRAKATQPAAPAQAAAADTQTVQTVTNQDGGQLAPTPETVQQVNTADKSAGETLVQSGQDGTAGEVQLPAAGEVQLPAGGDAAKPEEKQPSLVIVNNSPSLQVIPTTDAQIDPYGSFVVPEHIVEDADRIQRLKTEVNALNELKGYEMIELRFSVAAAE